MKELRYLWWILCKIQFWWKISLCALAVSRVWFLYRGADLVQAPSKRMYGLIFTCREVEGHMHTLVPHTHAHVT